MAAWEHQLISRIIRTGELSEVIEWGITAQDFTTAEAQSMFGRMIEYRQMPETAGAVWGPMSLHSLYPNYVICDDPNMTTDALCMEVRKNRVKAQGRQLVKEAGDLIEYDPVGAMNLLLQRSTDIHNDCSPKKTDVHVVDGFRHAVTDMEMIDAGIDVSVCPWPWSPLQDKTLGIRATDYIIFFGRPKSMKSWVLCFLIAWFIEHGKRLLIYTKEMPAWEICERIGCVLAEVDYERFTQGVLVPDERASVNNIVDWLEMLRETSMFVVLDAKDTRGKDTVSWLTSKVEKYLPDAVFVDGIYLMKDQQGAK
jgi:replicative DNA helicase